MGLRNAIKKEISRSREKRRRRREERRRIANRPYMECAFEDGISYEKFQELAQDAVDGIKGRRIEITVKGPFIEGLVWSNTNLSTWRFTVDFNDYGHITGQYWLSSENDQSVIPESIAKAVSFEIDKILFDLQNENGGTVSE